MIPSPETRKSFDVAISKTFTLANQSWTTDQKPVDTAQQNQLRIGSAININALLDLLAAGQKRQRVVPGSNPFRILSNHRFNTATFDNFSVIKYYAEIDGTMYPKDPIMTTIVKIINKINTEV